MNEKSVATRASKRGQRNPAAAHAKRDARDADAQAGSALPTSSGHAFEAIAVRHPSTTDGPSPLPWLLQRRLESASGFSMDDVGVHYDSLEPARIGALAFTRGLTIQVAPGSEATLPHEAWHVAQQKQGRVGATALHDGAAINDEPGLEREADMMASQLMHEGSEPMTSGSSPSAIPPGAPIQAWWEDRGDNHFIWRPPPLHPSPADLQDLPPRASYEDPNTGKKKAGGARGFWAPGGLNQTSVHHAPGGDVQLGAAGPAAFPGLANETIDYGPFETTHAGVQPQQFLPPPAATPRVPPPPGLAPLSGDARTQYLDEDTLAAAAAIPRQGMGQVMGLSANEAFQRAGQQQPPGGAHHLHLTAHSHLGRDAQDNGAAGAGGANQRHRVAEQAGTTATRGGFGPLFTTTRPVGITDAEYHLADEFEYEIQAAGVPHEAAHPFRFDLRDGTMPRAGDQAVANQNVQAGLAFDTIYQAVENHMDPEAAAAEMIGAENMPAFLAWCADHGIEF